MDLNSDRLTGRWRNRNKFSVICTSINIIRFATTRWIRLAGYVLHVGEIINIHIILTGKHQTIWKIQNWTRIQ